MKASTTLELSRELEARIERVAQKSGQTPHAFMVDALERQLQREARMQAYVQEALEADRDIEPARDEVRVLAVGHQRELDYPE